MPAGSIGDMSERPDLRVVRGAPTPEELAAIVGVLWSRRAGAVATAGAGAGPAAPVGAVSRWRASALPHPGGLPRPGRGAWVGSAR
jgi:hypothetical protein